MPRRDGFSIGRDPGAVFGRGGGAGCADMELQPGQTGVWDGRYEVVAGGALLRVGADRLSADPNAVAVYGAFSTPGAAPPAHEAPKSERWLGPERLSHLMFTGR